MIKFKRKERVIPFDTVCKLKTLSENKSFAKIDIEALLYYNVAIILNGTNSSAQIGMHNTVTEIKRNSNKGITSSDILLKVEQTVPIIIIIKTIY